MKILDYFKNSPNNFKAIVAMILAVLSVTLMSVQAKIIGPDYHPIQIAFARGIIVLILLTPLIYKLGGINFLKTTKPFLHLFRSLSGLIGNLLFFYSLHRIPVADVTVISMAVPIFSSILAIIFLREIIGWRRWTAIIFGFFGVLIALDPSTDIKIASIIAVIATFMWSTTIIFLRILGTTENPVKTVFYFMLISVICTSCFQPFFWKEPSVKILFLFLGLGTCAFLTQILMTYALQKAQASVVSPFNYTGILWAILFDLLIWDVLPLVNTLAGGVIITISGIYIFHRETKKKG